SEMGKEESRSRKIGQLRSIVSMNEDAKNELNYVLKAVELSTELILEDLDDSISLDHHSQLWSALRWSIDRAKGSTKDKISTTNTASSVASAFSSLMNLLHLLDSEYDLPTGKAPSPFISTPSYLLKTRKASEEGKTTILSYLAVRVGDIFRYKKDIAASAQWYRYAINVDPSNGEGWNQIGILSAQLGSPLDAVYSYYRATFTTNPSTIASSNILTVLDAHLDQEPDEDTDDDSFVLHTLALIHYLRPLSSSLLSYLPSLLSSPRRLLPFVAAFSSLDHHSTTSSSLIDLFQNGFNHFKNEIDDMDSFDSSTLATLNLYNRVLSTESISSLLENRSREETDLFQMDHFICSPLSFSSQ
ncbi:smg-7, partial [Pristionchus pacificus]